MATDSQLVVANSLATLDSALAAPHSRRVVVMTMGALHAGHLALVDRARILAGPDGQVVVTIFVNPLQFGPDEDFDRYPRDLDADLALLDGHGVDVVFAPSAEDMYPGGTPRVTVSSGELGTLYEGAARPGHFDGVLTVVLKLLQLTTPDIAVFGQKDAQQLMLIRRMVTDFNLPVTIEAVPIVREDDGLARSSRNAYLNDHERTTALALSQILRSAADAGQAGATVEDIRAAALDVLAAHPAVDLDYFCLVDPATVEPVRPDFHGEALALIAARVGSVRLIDNMNVPVDGTGGT